MPDGRATSNRAAIEYGVLPMSQDADLWICPTCSALLPPYFKLLETHMKWHDDHD